VFVRIGDGLAAATTFAWINVLSLPVRAFFVLNLVLAGAWLILATMVARENRRLRDEASGP
jgi:hypothetical protein